MSLHSLVCELETKNRQQRSEMLVQLLQKMKIPYNIQEFDISGQKGHNIVVTKTGLSKTKFVVGAHYDIVSGAGGANDNTSGVVILLELIKAFFAYSEVKNTLEFVFFDCEETGQLGSYWYVRQSDSSVIKGMINLDMCGTGDTIIFDHKKKPDSFLPKAVTSACQQLNAEFTALQRIPPGDDWQFETVGIPAVSLAIVPQQIVKIVNRLAKITHPTSTTASKLCTIPQILLDFIGDKPVIKTMHTPKDRAELVTEEALRQVFVTTKKTLEKLNTE